MNTSVCVCVCVHPGQCHLRGELQRGGVPAAAGGPGPASGEEVCDRPGARETAEPPGAGD